MMQLLDLLLTGDVILCQDGIVYDTLIVLAGPAAVLPVMCYTVCTVVLFLNDCVQFSLLLQTHHRVSESVRWSVKVQWMILDIDASRSE